MRIKVNVDNVKIVSEDVIHQGEYNINQCYFEFCNEYEGLLKVALFVKNNNTYKQIINDNQCKIAPEVLNDVGNCFFGVYAYKIENEDLVLRYSPKPDRFSVYEGSYKPSALNSKPITPSELEQYQQALNDSLNEVRLDLEKVVKIGEETKKQGDYAKEQGDRLVEANKEAELMISNFETNVEEYTNSFNTNATTKLEEYNTNAETKLEKYNINTEEKLKEYNDNTIQKVDEFNQNASIYDKKIADNKLQIIDVSNRLNRAENNLFDSGKASGSNINLQDSTLAEFKEIYINGVCEQELSSPSPYLPQEIKVIENNFNLISCRGNLETDDYIESKVLITLPENEFAGKINDTIRDRFKLTFNKEDGNYHLYLEKNVNRLVLDGTENVENYASSTYEFRVYPNKEMKKDETVLCTHLIGSTPAKMWEYRNTAGYNLISTTTLNSFLIIMDGITTSNDIKAKLAELRPLVYYPLAEPYTIDLGVIDMPLSYYPNTNVFTDSPLSPIIEVEYYRDFKVTINTMQEEIASNTSRITDLEAIVQDLQVSQ